MNFPETKEVIVSKDQIQKYRILLDNYRSMHLFNQMTVLLMSNLDLIIQQLGNQPNKNDTTVLKNTDILYKAKRKVYTYGELLMDIEFYSSKMPYNKLYESVAVNGFIGMVQRYLDQKEYVPYHDQKRRFPVLKVESQQRETMEHKDFNVGLTSTLIQTRQDIAQELRQQETKHTLVSVASSNVTGKTFQGPAMIME